MEGYTLVDGIVLALIILSAVLAYSRGLVRELMSIAGWVAAAILGFVFAPAVEPLVREVPVLRDIIGTSCELGILAGFAAVFAVALVVVSIFTPLLAGAVQNSALGPIDQGLGFLFGVARAVILVAIALVVYDRIMGGEGGISQLDDSRTVTVFADVEEQVSSWLPDDAPEWIALQYGELTQNCE
jgi:membrane protein required for colicin V production